MAVSSNALTLTDYALMANNPLVTRITYSLLENGSILADIPLVTKKAMVANGVRWVGNLPSVTWSKLNVDPTVTKGEPTPYQEQAYLIRNAIDVDKKLVQDETQIVDPRGAQIEAYLRSVVHDMNDKFINNDHVTGNADSIVGLRYRLNNQSVYGVNSDMKIDAGGVDLSWSGISATKANQFIEYIQLLLDYMGSTDGDGVVLYMNDLLKRRFEAAVRLLGAGAGFSIVKDAFGRNISMYRGAIVRDIGRKVDQSTRIITYTENADGTAGNSNYTSIYGVKYGPDHMVGWQFDDLASSIEDVGLIGNGGTTYRTVIDYAVGLYPQHTRCIGRLYDIKVQ